MPSGRLARLLLGPHGLLGRHGHPVREHVLAERQLPDEDRPDVVAEPLRGAGVDLRVALPVVADEHPLDVGQLVEQPAQLGHLVGRDRCGTSRCWSGPSR